MGASRLRLIALVVPLVLGCASRKGENVPTTPATAVGVDAGADSASVRRSVDVVSPAELDRLGGDVNLLDALRRIRPQFFQARGWIVTRADAANMVQVYVNGSRQTEGVRALQRYLVRDVKEVRRLSPSRATQAYGNDNASGAIVVTLR